MITLKKQTNHVLEKILQNIIVLGLYFLLCTVYSDVVVDTYSFGGFTKIDKPHHEFAVLLLITSVTIVPNIVKNSNDIFILLSFYFLILPSAVLCSMEGSNPLFMILIFAGVLFVKLSYTCVKLIAIKLFGDSRKSKDVNSPVLFWLPFLFMISVLIALACQVNHQFNLSFKEVYNYRFDFNDSLKFPMNYLLPFAAGPVLSYLVALSLSRRQWMMLLLVIMSGVLFFGFSTHKAFLFTPFLVLFIYIALTRKNHLFNTIAASFGVGCALALFGNGFVAELTGNTFVNRVLFIPAQIHYVFFEEFSRIGCLYWAESKISFGLFDTPLHLNSVNYIAEVMTGDPKIGANVGWIANGYMNLSITGVIIYSIIISILLFLVDCLSCNFNNYVLLSSFSPPYFYLITSSDLFVSLLTGGILPMLAILVLVIRLSKKPLSSSTVKK